MNVLEVLVDNKEVVGGAIAGILALIGIFLRKKDAE